MEMSKRVEERADEGWIQTVFSWKWRRTRFLSHFLSFSLNLINCLHTFPSWAAEV